VRKVNPPPKIPPFAILLKQTMFAHIATHHQMTSEQYIDNIGGYQPAQKWLKDRKGRTLEFDEILHYQKIIVALSETDRIMKEIDLMGVE